MDEFDLEFVELQFIWDKEVGDLDKRELECTKQLLCEHGKKVSCLSRHIFAGTTVRNRVGDKLHTLHTDSLKRVMKMAHSVGSPLVRIMTPKKETILWGGHGAKLWNVTQGAWGALLLLIETAVDLAQNEVTLLVAEAGNGTMVNSCYTARNLIDDPDARDTLKVLWDPANSCWCHETAFPDGYEEIRGGYLGHIHLKDKIVDTPRATLEVCLMGEGQLGAQFRPMANALRTDGYDGVISLDCVYRPGNGDFEAGFRECVGPFKSLFA